MTDDRNKSVDAYGEELKRAHDETARRIIEEYEGYMGELIAKHLGYEYGRGYRAGVNQFEDVCRILAKHVVALRTGDPVGPCLDPTAQHFITEAEKTRQSLLECKVVVDVQEHPQ